MLEYFKKAKFDINLFLSDHFNKNAVAYTQINRWGKDICERLSAFIASGKMIRGGLAILGYKMFKKDNSIEAMKIAGAMELFQSSFLIHDDIIDNDTMRRGDNSIFYQYKEAGDEEGFDKSYHYGESMGICLGDISFFMAFQLLSSLKADPAIVQKLLDVCSNEYVFVGLAQMEDIYFSKTKKNVNEKEILNLYLYKTARYTFSLPLIAGAILADQSENVLSVLSDIGEALGVIFQIKDDEIGIFGNEEEIGKTVGIDIIEEKKTLFYLYLFDLVKGNDRKELNRIFGKSYITLDDLEKVREIIIHSGVKLRIDRMVESLINKAEDLITSLNIARKYKGVMLEIIQYSIERTH